MKDSKLGLQRHLVEILSPGLVTLACNPSGGIKVGRTVSWISLAGSAVALCGLPVPSQELAHVARAKAWLTRALEKEAMR